MYFYLVSNIPSLPIIVKGIMMKKLKVAAVMFEDYELLDFYGPMQIFGMLPEYFEIYQVAEKVGPIRSSSGADGQGILGYAEYAFVQDNSDDASQNMVYEKMAYEKYDIVLVPGGFGTRAAVDNLQLITWLQQQAKQCRYITSVCTGAGVLAAAGLLDGYRATTNKASFDWPQSQGPKTNWVKEARWVEDRDRITSAGVSAGIDMALKIVELVINTKTAESVANYAEYEWHRDPHVDPFAKVFGLVE